MFERTGEEAVQDCTGLHAQFEGIEYSRFITTVNIDA